MSILIIIAIGSILFVLVKNMQSQNKLQNSDFLESSSKQLYKECKNEMQFVEEKEELFRLKKERLDNVEKMLTEKQRIRHQFELEAYKMTKSVELYNLLSKLVEQNPRLAASLRSNPPEYSITILGNAANLTQEQRKEHRQMLYQVVNTIKCLPTISLPEEKTKGRFQPITLAKRV